MGIGNLIGLPLSPSFKINSLPLMGIGNMQARGEQDRKLTAHYPSWGSETHEAREMAYESNISLPLMGIGNVGRMVRGHVGE